jgi:riboflavin biosynthesis pyrimidine reductase
MERNNKDYRFAFGNFNGKDFFQKHNDRMREFRRSHADVARINGSRVDEAAHLDGMQHLQIPSIMKETGGARLLNSATDWSRLVTVPNIAKYKLSQN